MARVKTTKKATAKRSTPRTATKPKPRPKPATTEAKANAAAKPMAKRADFGKPVDGFFAKQPPALRAVLAALRAIVEEEVPGAEAAIKWGMPWYTLDGEMVVGFGAHKAHVNLILSGPPGSFADPEGRLSGEGKTGKHLKLTSVDELPREAVRDWVRAAAANARAKQG